MADDHEATEPFTPESDELKCNVCNVNTACGVACSSTGPVSFAYCVECLQAGREPYGALVAMGACCGGVGREFMAEWTEPTIAATLEFFKKTYEQYRADVAVAIAEFEASDGG